MDHKALVQSYLPYLNCQSKGILAHWYVWLARFLPALKLENKPGPAIVAADALSRTPVVDARDSSSVKVVLEGISVDRPINIQYVQEQQREDGELAKLIPNYM